MAGFSEFGGLDPSLLNERSRRAIENAALRKTPASGGGNPLGNNVAAPGSKLDPKTGAAKPTPFEFGVIDDHEVTITDTNIKDKTKFGFTRKEKSELDILKFPLNLEERRLPYVMFKIFETQTGKVDTVNSLTEQSLFRGFQTFKNTAAAIGQAADTATLNIPSSAADAVSSAAQQTEIGKDLAAGLSKLKEAFSNFTLNRNTEQLSTAIALFMPEGLATSYDHQYDELSLTAVLGMPGLFAQGMSSKTGEVEAKDAFLVEAAATKLIDKLPGFKSSEQLTNLLLFSTTGRAINPQLELLYQTPKLRSFTFDFRLVPRNSSEASMINAIIKNFKYFAAPELPAGSTGRYFIPPARFEIEFYHHSEPSNYLFKTKQCVLESISIDYAPNGYASHYDGAPVETRLQMTFRETVIIDKQAVGEGY